jgi:hypothetical protein
MLANLAGSESKRNQEAKEKAKTGIAADVSGDSAARRHNPVNRRAELL